MRQLEIMHHDGTSTFWPLPEGARWRTDPQLGLIHYAGPGSDRTHIPWQSIKYYHVNTSKEQDELLGTGRTPAERPNALVIGSSGGHLCFGRTGHACDVCGYPDELPLSERREVVSVWRSTEVDGPGNVQVDAAECGGGPDR